MQYPSIQYPPQHRGWTKLVSLRRGVRATPATGLCNGAPYAEMRALTHALRDVHYEDYLHVGAGATDERGDAGASGGEKGQPVDPHASAVALLQKGGLLTLQTRVTNRRLFRIIPEGGTLQGT
jgi:hypothetical protein